jgi:signal transduction histidine kinase
MVSRTLIPQLSRLSVRPHKAIQVGADVICPNPFVLRPAFAALCVAMAYYGGTKIGFALTPSHDPIATFWPPNAILLAVLLLSPRRMWWILLLAVLPAHLLVQLQTGVPLLTSLGWFAGNTGEALLGAVLISRFEKRGLLFDSIRGVIIFLVFGVLIAPLTTSFLDAAVVVVTGWGNHYWQLWLSRLFSNMLAELTLVPTIVVMASGGIARFQKATLARYAEACLLIIGTLLVSTLVFGGEQAARNSIPALIYTPLPFLLWASVRFGPGGLGASLFVVAMLSVWNAMHGRGPFTSDSLADNVISLQTFLCVITVPLMLLAAIVTERRRSEESLINLSGKLIGAQEQERRRIGRELHDDIGQRLTALAIELHQFRGELMLNAPPRVDKLCAQVSEICTAIREVSHGLYSSQLEYLGLGPAIRYLCQDTRLETSRQIKFLENNLPSHLPSEISLCLYRVAQEGLHNIARHSHAQSAAIELKAHNGSLFLEIADDGVGFTPGQRLGSGLGLDSMRERLRSVGGGLEITSAPRRGTRIEAWVPLKNGSRS